MKKRELYLDKLLLSVNLNEWVKIIVGIRRCGKSFLMELMKQHLISTGVKPEQIISINYEEARFNPIRQGDAFNEYVLSHIKDNQQYYLFVDEVQELERWAFYINSLRTSNRFDIYVTGSNSRIWIGDDLTYLGGRYITTKMYPLSIKEFADFVGSKKIDDDLYDEFLEGSFPALALQNNQQLKQNIVADLYASIFYRDILLKKKIKDEVHLARVARFVFENIGSSTSINNIEEALRATKVVISFNTVEKFVKAMVEAYVIYHCPRFDVLRKENLKTHGKYYVVDFALRNYLIATKNLNTGRILENFIYLELLKAGYDVKTGKVGRDYEIDFVATKKTDTLYIQVSLSIENDETRKREVRPFDFIGDNHKRILVTNDRGHYEVENCQHMLWPEFVNFINKL